MRNDKNEKLGHFQNQGQFHFTWETFINWNWKVELATGNSDSNVDLLALDHLFWFVFQFVSLTPYPLATK